MLVTTARAGEMAGVSRQAIHKAIHRKELKATLIGDRAFVHAEDVMPWARRPRAHQRGRIAKPKNPGAVS